MNLYEFIETYYEQCETIEILEEVCFEELDLVDWNGL
jgi:hypothetical protein